MKQSKQLVEIIDRFCLRDDLSTYDPYDIWKTRLGFQIKYLYNNNKYIGIIPASILTIFDIFINNSFRLFYAKQEYPIVRAFAALSLLNAYTYHVNPIYLNFAKKHLNWLLNNSCQGYHGYGWGLNFRYAVCRGLVYDENTPLSTMTPYILEALIEYSCITDSSEYDKIIRGIYDFFTKDIKVMDSGKEFIATSYAPRYDRIVTNAISYTMYSLALLSKYLPKALSGESLSEVGRLFNYIRLNQRGDGSWFYSPQGRSFIDCFHSCIVLKNLIKTNRIVPLHDATSVIKKGYDYIKANFYEERIGLFKRFSVANKPSMIKFDLYDNAEMLNLSLLLEDQAVANQLVKSIQKQFCRGINIFSQIDVWGRLRNRNTLRWAVMPYIYALSQVLKYI